MFVLSCQTSEEPEKIKTITPSALYYKDITLKTNLDSLVNILGKPQSIERRESTRIMNSDSLNEAVQSHFTQMPDTNWHKIGEIVEFQLYTYELGEAALKFAIHKQKAQIMEIIFDANLTILLGKIHLNGQTTEEYFSTHFDPLASGTISNDSIQQKQYIFPSNSKRKIGVYETPIFYFEQGKLIRFFYMPDI